MPSPRTRTPRRSRAKPDPLAWLDYPTLQATLDDPNIMSMDSTGMACTTTSVDMFPERGSTDRAKAVCAGCPITYQCLAYALISATLTNDFGVWGGTSKSERNRIRRRVDVPLRARPSQTRGVA